MTKADFVYLTFAFLIAYSFIITILMFMYRDESKRFLEWYQEAIKNKNDVQEKLKNITKIIEGKK